MRSSRRAMCLWALLALVPASLPAQDSAPAASPSTAAAPASETTTPAAAPAPERTAAQAAQAALDAASAYRTLVSTMAFEAVAASTGTTSTTAEVAALELATKDFASERVSLTQALIERLDQLPEPSDALAYLDAREGLQEQLDRRRREANVATGQAQLSANQGGDPARAALAADRARFLSEYADILELAAEEQDLAWVDAYPDEAARAAAEAEALKARTERKQKAQEEALEKARRQAAEAEQTKREAAELAEKARSELEAARNEEETQLAELRLAYANLKNQVEDIKSKALNAEAEARKTDEELESSRADIAARLPVLTSEDSVPHLVSRYRDELVKTASHLREQADLDQQEIELLREEVPAIRARYRELADLYDQLEEGMARKGRSAVYRRRVYFARLAQRKASEKLDLFRTFVEWRERGQLARLRRADVLEAASRKLETRAEVRYLGQTRDQLEQFLLFLLGTLLAAFVVDLLARTIFRSFSEKTKWTWDDIALEELSTPIRLLVVLGGLQLSLAILTLDADASRILENWAGALRAAWIGFLAWRIVNIIARVLEPKIVETDAKLDDQLFRFIHRGLRTTIVGVTLVFMLEAFGWKVTSLLAGLGIGGLAFALAAKDTLANLFGSIVLFMDRPFKVGNWVIINGTEGVVEDIGIRSTRIRTFKDTVVTIPNATVANAQAENVHSFRKRRLYFTIELRFDTPVDTVEKVVQAMRTLLDDHPMILSGHYVYVTGLKASGVEIMVYCFVATRDWGEWLVHCQDVYLATLRLLEDHGAGLAFPTQTIELEHVKGLGMGFPPGMPPPEGE